MKSTINTIADYRQAPLDKEVIIRCPEEHIQAQLRHLTRGFKRTEAVQILEKGDVAVLAMESELPKFNKPGVFVTVGGGLFHKEFEESLLGHQVGETFETKVDGKSVKVTVKQASRTIFPEPTDEMAAAYAAEHEEFKGAVTVAAYQEKVVEQQLKEEKQNAFFDAMDAVMDYVLTHSDFDFDADEVAEAVAQSREEINSQLGEEGKSIETLTPEQFKGYFGVETVEELEKALRNQAEWAIAQDLWLMSIHGVDDVEKIEGYPFKFVDDFVRETVTFKEEK